MVTTSTPKSKKNVTINPTANISKVSQKSAEKPVESTEWKRVQLTENFDNTNADATTNASTSKSKSQH